MTNENVMFLFYRKNTQDASSLVTTSLLPSSVVVSFICKRLYLLCPNSNYCPMPLTHAASSLNPVPLTRLSHYTSAVQIYPCMDRPVMAGCACCDWCLLCRAGRYEDERAAGDAVPAGHGWETVRPEPETLRPGFQWGEDSSRPGGEGK